ncbi:MAG: hypothetical protein WKG32_13825 [Gemmatimonadaceae bacterium]
MGTTRSKAEGLSDHDLVLAMREREPDAVREFIKRFRPFLAAEARRLGVPAWAREEAVADCLTDAALELIAGRDTTIPRSLPKYLVSALRHDFLDARRGETRRERRDQCAAEAMEGYGEHAVASSCSQHTLRASYGPAWEDVPLSPALERLSTMLGEGLTEEERRLLGWVGNYVPLREIALWLGVSYAAAAQRVWRLRERLRVVGTEHTMAQDGAEGAELRRFVRCTSVMGAHAAAAARACEKTGGLGTRGERVEQRPAHAPAHRDSTRMTRHE